MLHLPLVFLDVETTGLNPEVHEIIELGAVVARAEGNVLRETARLDFKIQPKNIALADPQALRINGYDASQWLFAATLEDVLRQFKDTAKGGVLVAHNLSFDWAFLSKAFEKTEIENTLHYHKLDTISIAFAKLAEEEDINKFSLRALCEHFGIENKRAHSAFSDAYATFELFKKLMGMR